MNDYAVLSVGVICAGVGGELFVRGSVGLAQWLRISPGIIGATVAAFATSSPELSVAISSALAGEPEISLGDALGSNVINVALILALALVISGIQSPRDSIKRDYPVALLAPIATGILFLDGVLSRYDGLLMLVMFFAWLLAAIIEARKQRSAAEQILGEHREWLVMLSCISGVGLLVAAGSFIVMGASGIALAFGIDEFIIGATIVAIGTSTPELATTIIAKIRGHDEVGLSTILGSNIFNGIFIVAVASIIHPITAKWQDIVITLAFGFIVLVCVCPLRSAHIDRGRGVLLLVLYVVYLSVLNQNYAIKILERLSN